MISISSNGTVGPKSQGDNDLGYPWRKSPGFDGSVNPESADGACRPDELKALCSKDSHSARRFNGDTIVHYPQKPRVQTVHESPRPRR
jgi:hypothetical protein